MIFSIIIHSTPADFTFSRFFGPIIAVILAGSAIGCMLARICRCSFKIARGILKAFVNLRFSCLLASIIFTIDAALVHSIGLAKMVIVLVELALNSSAIKGISKLYVGKTASSGQFRGFKYFMLPFLIVCVIIINSLVLSLPSFDFPDLPIDAWIILWIACVPVVVSMALHLAFRASNFASSLRRFHEMKRTNGYPVVQFEVSANQDYLKYVLAHADQDKDRKKELNKRAYQHYIQKNRMSKSLRRKVFVIGIGVLTLFSIQMIQAMDSYTPSNGSLSNLTVQPSCKGSTPPSSSFYLTRDASVSFTTNVQGRGFVSASWPNGTTVYTQVCTVKKGLNNITFPLSPLYFKNATYKVSVMVAYTVGIFQRTTQIAQASITVLKEISYTKLKIDISIIHPTETTSCFQVVFFGNVTDPSSKAAQHVPVEIWRYNVEANIFDPLAMNVTDDHGRFAWATTTNFISPWPYIGRASTQFNPVYQKSQDDDQVSENQVYDSMRHAGPNDDSIFISNGIKPSNNSNINAQYNCLKAGWNWGTAKNQTKDFGNFTMRVIEGAPVTGISAKTMYATTYSNHANVTIEFVSPWIYYEGIKPTSGTLKLSFGTFQEQEGLYKDVKKYKDVEIFSFYIAMLNSEGRMIYIKSLDAADSIPLKNMTINLVNGTDKTELFDQPGKFKLVLGGTIHPGTVLSKKDCPDRWILAFNFATIEIHHAPVYSTLASSENKWQDWDRYEMSRQMQNIAIFNGSRDATMTSIPCPQGTLPTPSIEYEGISTPITSSASELCGWENYHFYQDWRKRTNQTWGFAGSEKFDGFDQACGYGSNYLMTVPGWINAATTGWKSDIRNSYASLK